MPQKIRKEIVQEVDQGQGQGSDQFVGRVIVETDGGNLDDVRQRLRELVERIQNIPVASPQGGPSGPQGPQGAT